MKKTILAFILISCLGFKIADYEVKKSTSEVEQMEGFNIFYKSKPVREYERIGHYKVGVSWTGSPDELLKKLVSQSVKKYPAGDGLLISGDMKECDIIKLK
jgi:hypothetical protein